MLELTSFIGQIPRIEDRNLPDMAATVASNARMNSGGLKAFRGLTTRHAFSENVQSFTIWNDTPFGFPEPNVSAVPGPIAEDRLYLTGQAAGPQMFYQGTYYSMGVPKPGTAPTLTLIPAADPGSENQALEQSLLYAYSWVTDLGEESAMSLLAGPILVTPGEQVQIDGFEAPPANRRVTNMRIYRSVTSASGITDLYFLVELPAATISHTDTDTTTALTGVAPNLDFDQPPTTMDGLIAMPNGMMVAFDGREILFCEPYLPHAWPRKYSLFTNDDIVGLAAFGSTVAVMTTGTPYIVQGLHPDSMAMEKTEQEYPCVSRAGIVDMGYAAAYPSNDGLVMVSGQGAQLVTQDIFTREQWRGLNPDTFNASRIEQRYAFAHLPDGAADVRIGLIDLRGDLGFYAEIAIPSLELRFDVATSNMLSLGEDQRTISIVDDPNAARLTFTWRSKPVDFPSLRTFGAVRAKGRAAVGGDDSVTIRVYADGALLHTTSGLNRIHRLPQKRAAEWQIELEGQANITNLAMAVTPEDLARAG
ncbi:hypothetical protein [uncultured Roseobacter sp.]|uniref:hypothetical protein n=1 Tax=uncultured Roseobacter sp. TaxID=114847 RepID=UPI0026280F28|nr:hypothetical protein [uncultured Roseobacter sp.]